ncbi:unnamed protein product [Colias eurytheme]|nr:unnamed protein product [Colias eurytheme]
MADEYFFHMVRMEDITEQDDRHLAGVRKEIRNGNTDLTVIIPENPFSEIEVDDYPPLKFSCPTAIRSTKDINVPSGV